MSLSREPSRAHERHRLQRRRLRRVVGQGSREERSSQPQDHAGRFEASFSTRRTSTSSLRTASTRTTELEARHEVLLENYVKIVNIEALEQCYDMAHKDILPGYERFTRRSSRTRLLTRRSSPRTSTPPTRPRRSRRSEISSATPTRTSRSLSLTFTRLSRSLRALSWLTSTRISSSRI